MQTMHLKLFNNILLLNNKESCGMTKGEAGGRIIEKFVGLRTILYAHKMFEGEEEKNEMACKRML